MLLDQIAFGVPLLVTRITWILTFLKSQRKKGIPPPLLYSTGTVTFCECPPRLIKGIRTYPLFSVYEVSRTSPCSPFRARLKPLGPGYPALTRPLIPFCACLKQLGFYC